MKRGGRLERTAYAKVRRQKKNDILERTAWPGCSGFLEKWKERRFAVWTTLASALLTAGILYPLRG